MQWKILFNFIIYHFYKMNRKLGQLERDFIIRLTVILNLLYFKI